MFKHSIIWELKTDKGAGRAVLVHLQRQISGTLWWHISRITVQLSKSSIVRAPLWGCPRSGAHTIDDFKDWAVYCLSVLSLFRDHCELVFICLKSVWILSWYSKMTFSADRRWAHPCPCHTYFYYVSKSDAIGWVKEPDKLFLLFWPGFWYHNKASYTS